ncbi:MAG: DNA repair protein RadA [Nitrospira sp.]|nr:DNA repair protein RadA [Nitrospira sp.]
MKTGKPRTIFVCQECGGQTPRWAGRCPDCGQWNSLKEETTVRLRGQRVTGDTESAMPINEVAVTKEIRFATGLSELDRVLGGGVVPGSIVLVGGDPGIGKTTLLLQTLHGLEQRHPPVLYVTGEESAQQIKMRGDRLGVLSSSLYILTETSLEGVLKVAATLGPTALVVDSVQTVHTDQVTSAPGTISQVQEVACQLMWYAKRTGVPVFLIGHVTKEGMIAGPKLLEHIVDTVLYFEGDKSHAYRILRAVKNRFGATNEIGVFEMNDEGLQEVANPSELFLAGRPASSTGSVVVSSLEGSRPILVELQALVTATGYAMPKRMANGIELNRVALLLAVVEKRLGLQLSGYDVYLNVVGGLRLDEPAVDVGIVAAIVSSFRDHALDGQTCCIGEVGLGGEIRPVSQVDLRIREAMKLGFQRCILPQGNITKQLSNPGIELFGVREVGEVFDHVVTSAS